MLREKNYDGQARDKVSPYQSLIQLVSRMDRDVRLMKSDGVYPPPPRVSSDHTRSTVTRHVLTVIHTRPGDSAVSYTHLDVYKRQQ